MRRIRSGAGIVAAALALAGAPSAAWGDQTTTGTAAVPGTGTVFNDDVNYTIILKKVPGTDSKVSFWLNITNPNSNPVTLIACAMVRLNRAEISMPQYDVSKNGNTWNCTRNGNVMRPPSYHFGCTGPITIPANSSGYAFDGTYDLGRPFEESELTAIYWDILQGQKDGQPCTLAQECIDVLNTKDVNLGPGGAFQAVTDSSLNLWGGNVTCPEDLTAGVVRTAALVETGNWVTMAAGGEFPARLVGTLSGAPPGARFAIEFPDATMFEGFAGDDGMLALDIPMTIPADPHALMRVMLDTQGPIPDGVCASCAIDVVSEVDGEIYQMGQIMHTIGLSFPGDSVPPNIDAALATVDPATRMIDFDLRATDPTTKPIAASVQITTGDAPPQVVALTFGIPAGPQTVDQSQFIGQAGPFEAGTTVQWEAMVIDVMGNLSTSGPQNIEIPAAACTGCCCEVAAIDAGRSGASRGPWFAGALLAILGLAFVTARRVAG